CAERFCRRTGRGGLSPVWKVSWSKRRAWGCGWPRCSYSRERASYWQENDFASSCLAISETARSRCLRADSRISAAAPAFILDGLSGYECPWSSGDDAAIAAKEFGKG